MYRDRGHYLARDFRDFPVPINLALPFSSRHKTRQSGLRPRGVV
jgi:hypothetical protein